MKNILIQVILLFQMTALSKAQSFEYISSTPDDEIIQDVIQDSIGNYYLIGWKGIYGVSYSGLIIKLNSTGDSIKTLIIPAINNNLYLEYIQRLNDSIFVIVGDAQMPNSND